MFFNSIPDFLYPDFKVAGKYKLSKNIFRRVRARDSFNAIYTTSTSYTIQDGETPDSIAYKEYGDSEWFWTILILNNIIDIHDMWPMAADELDKYIQKKYKGYENKPRYWETTEIKNFNGEVVIPSGVIVELFQDKLEQSLVDYKPQLLKESLRFVSQFSPKGSTTIELGSAENLLPGDLLNAQYDTKITNVNGTTITIDRPLEYNVFPGYAIKFTRYEDWTREYIYNISKDSDGNIISMVKRVATADTLREVTNRDYEYELNELKREIKLPKRNFLSTMERELIQLMEYDTTYKLSAEGYRISEEP
jgi:hypothetical protein